MTAKELLDLLKIYEENGIDLSTFKIINEYGDEVVDAIFFGKSVCLEMLWSEDEDEEQ